MLIQGGINRGSLIQFLAGKRKYNGKSARGRRDKGQGMSVVVDMDVVVRAKKQLCKGRVSCLTSREKKHQWYLEADDITRDS